MRSERVSPHKSLVVAERHIKQVFQCVSFLSGSPDMPQSACVLTATQYPI